MREYVKIEVVPLVVKVPKLVKSLSALSELSIYDYTKKKGTPPYSEMDFNNALLKPHSRNMLCHFHDIFMNEKSQK